MTMRCTRPRPKSPTSRASRYPDLHIPYHSRWRHFEAGGVDRKAELDRLLAAGRRRLRARAMIDLAWSACCSTPARARTGNTSKPPPARRFTRSEGLGVASFHAFTGGLFSSDPAQPLQVDAAGLRGLVTDRLAEAFQVRPANPLVGLEGARDAAAPAGRGVAAQPEVFGPDGPARRPVRRARQPWARGAHGGRDGARHPVAAPDIAVGHLAGGQHDRARGAGRLLAPQAVRGARPDQGWVPFHKLSQWLTYSLLEPFEWAGVQVRGLDALTGLPEYRNGGLLLDTGVLRLRDPAWPRGTGKLGDEIDRRVARADRGAARRTGPAGAPAAAIELDAGRCRWPACWKAAPGPPAARWPSACAAAAAAAVASDGTVF